MNGTCVYTSRAFPACFILVFLCTLFSTSYALGKTVRVATVDSSINPGVALFIERTIKDAHVADDECLVIQLDTPGGLADSMRSIVKSIMESDVPVVVYVAPSGARAASAGVIITIAAHVAAMAPGTNIGAAHPVAMGKEIEGAMAKKVENDMVAYARSIADERGRNADWAEKAVRESVSITADEALKNKVVDLVAGNIEELLPKINGRTVLVKGKQRVIDVAGATVTYEEESLREKILRTIANPNIAYILMMLGMVGLYFELANPGAVFPGIVGAISLILSFYAFQTLPVNYAGVLLIILGLILFILEIKIASYGMLTIGGLTCLVLGSMFLFHSDSLGLVRVSWQVLVPTVAVVTLFFTVVLGLIVKAMLHKPTTGLEGLLGEEGQVTQLADSGEIKVFVHGETWNAESDERLELGDRIRVVGKKQFFLQVKKAVRSQGD
ncbi:MAG: nodulation protein NfeD [Deltaproteobacteria bacterium]|nr:nodulation protein NfeD [Deltaproteobacteria bacterium]